MKNIIKCGILSVGLFILGSYFDVAKATPANSAFVDDNFYQCIIDAYNDRGFSYSYDYNLSDEQLSYIENITCTKPIADTTGIDKLVNLVNLAYNGADSTNSTYFNLNELTKIKSVAIINAISHLDLSKNNKTNVSVFVAESWIEINNVEKIESLTLQNVNMATTDLDLTTASNLKTLNIIGSKIKNLKLKSNNLKNLTISSNDYIEQIDLSLVPNIENLVLKNGAFTSIDLSNNGKLVTLDLRYNENLKKIDISNNPNLESVKVDDGVAIINNSSTDENKNQSSDNKLNNNETSNNKTSKNEQIKEETVENPNTVVTISVIGLVVMSVIGAMLFKKKNLFNRV